MALGHLESLVADTGTRSPAEAFAAIGDNDSFVSPVLRSCAVERDDAAGHDTLLSAVWSGAVLSADRRLRARR